VEFSRIGHGAAFYFRDISEFIKLLNVFH